MKNSTPPAKKAAKKSQHTPTGRSSTGKFASFTDAPAKPLSDDEYNDLANKLETLNNLNNELVEYSKCVDQNRFDLIEAETALKDAEDNLRAVRENHQAAMREVAPLLNRLPTV